MACVSLPEIALPELGFGISISPPELVTPEFELDFCCKILEFPSFNLLPLPPLVLNAAAQLVLDGAVEAINTYLDAFAIECPKE